MQVDTQPGRQRGRLCTALVARVDSPLATQMSSMRVPLHAQHPVRRRRSYAVLRAVRSPVWLAFLMMSPALPRSTLNAAPEVGSSDGRRGDPAAPAARIRSTAGLASAGSSVGSRTFNRAVVGGLGPCQPPAWGWASDWHWGLRRSLWWRARTSRTRCLSNGPTRYRKSPLPARRIRRRSHRPDAS